MKKILFLFFLSLAATLAHAEEARFYEIYCPDKYQNSVGLYQFFSTKDPEIWKDCDDPYNILFLGEDPYLCYHIDLDKGEAWLLECDGGFDGFNHDGILEVPDHISYEGRDYPVTQVGRFMRNELTTVIIPESVTRVGGFSRNEELGYNTKLQKVVMHEGVKSIEYGAFGNCTFDIELPSSVESIGDYAFGGCTGLKSVDLKHVKKIGRMAFNFSGLETVHINFECGELPEGVFFGCENLREVTLGGNLKAIGAYAFQRCKMKSLSLPDGIESIGKKAFEECSVEEVVVNGGLASLGEYAFYRSSMKRVQLSGPLTTIPDDAFRGCCQLAEIKLPDSVTEIGKYAFHSCQSLADFEFPSSLTTIGEYAFNGCESLKEIILPEGFNYYHSDAFSGCSAVKTISFPSTIYNISWTAPFDSPSLQDVYCQSYFNLPESEFISLELEGKAVTLHVPEPFLETFKSSYPWKYFSEIVPLKEGDRFFVAGKNYEDGIDAALTTSQDVTIGSDGTLHIEGVKEGTEITVYDLSGRKLTSAKAAGTASTSIATTLKRGSMAIVKVGEKSVKVMH